METHLPVQITPQKRTESDIVQLATILIRNIRAELIRYSSTTQFAPVSITCYRIDEGTKSLEFVAKLAPEDGGIEKVATFTPFFRNVFSGWTFRAIARARFATIFEV